MTKIKMDEKGRDTYQESLKDYQDLKSAIDTSYKEGFEEGEMKNAIDTAMLMFQENESLEKIIKYTGVTAEELDKLK